MTDTDRIETLETQVRTLKKILFGLVALIAVGSLLAANALPKVPDVIQAKKFEVVNDDGKWKLHLLTTLITMPAVRDFLHQAVRHQCRSL